MAMPQLHMRAAIALMAACAAHAFLPQGPLLGSNGVRSSNPARFVSAEHRIASRVSGQSGLRLRMQDDFLKSLVPGTWALESDHEETGKEEFFLTLNPDYTLTMPPDAKGGDRDDRMRWKLKGTEFALEVPKRSSLSTSFMDRTFYGTLEPEAFVVKGSILDGEDEPEFVGRFVLKQINSLKGIPASGVEAAGSEWEWDGEVDEEAHL